MISIIYRRVLNIFKAIPLKAWGLSLLGGLLSVLVLIFGFLPIITIPVIAALEAGMASMYLAAYKGQEVSSNQLLGGFRNFKHVAGGMCWQYLWIFLWCLIPLAGPVIAIIKSISYSFTPYILISEPFVGALDALKQSMQDTKGHKAQIFAAVILPSLAFIILSTILTVLSFIPFAGILFAVINILVSLIYGLFAPLFLGLVQAGFYEYVRKPAPSFSSADSAASGENVTCCVCGQENRTNTKFCIKCGAKIN